MTFNYSRPYPGGRSPLMTRNVVSTTHPLAAQAGLCGLRQAARQQTHQRVFTEALHGFTEIGRAHV